MITFNPIHSNAFLLASKLPSSEKEMLTEAIHFQTKIDTNANIKAIKSLRSKTPFVLSQQKNIENKHKNPPHRRHNSTSNEH